ncbi:hypothetical protein ACNKHR_13190 [Shigella flexneri]
MVAHFYCSKEKLIILKEGKGLLPTALDITDNPRHLQIMELGRTAPTRTG